MEINSRQRLDGKWKIVRDPKNTGRENGWHTPENMAEMQDAAVPGGYEQVFPEYHGVVWYYRAFEVQNRPPENADFFIEFDQVDYLCEVWLNGKYLGKHMHAEEAFMLPCSGAVNLNGENLLAVRNFSPMCNRDPIDGIVLKEIPSAGRSLNLHNVDACSGGIVSSVWLAALPKIRIAGVFVQPDWLTGEIVCDVRLQNDTPQEEQGVELRIHFSQFREGRAVGMLCESVQVPPGESSHVFRYRVAEHKLWNLDDPFLYIALFSIKSGFGADAKAVRFGFRDFRVKDGFFTLNGRRIFLKSTHTVAMLAHMYQAKAMGFNMVRFLTSLPPTEILDLCDELGLMAYVESRAAWGMMDYENMPEHIAAYNDNMVKRNRNHASVTIWGLLNEHSGANPDFKLPQPTSKTIETVINYLPRLRALDNSRIVMLNSSRMDNRLDIGSVSNPGSDWWDYEWGKENPKGAGEGLAPIPDGLMRKIPPYVNGMGDIHLYPTVPQDRETNDFMRTVGHDSKPVFISEYGIGSQDDPMLAYLRYAELGQNLEATVPKRFYKVFCDGLMNFWSEYDMEGVYASPRDFIGESLHLHNRQRELGFDLIRSNPMCCGFSLTSMSSSNEGLAYGIDRLKPGIATAMQEGWAPLRWAMFTQGRVMYAGKPFTVEAVLCNEDVLKPGKYPARFRIKGSGGIAWAKDTDIDYPSGGYAGLPPLAATVLKDTVGALPAGDYVFAADLLGGGCPLGGRLKFTVLDPARVCGGPKSVAAWGLNEKTSEFLKSNGIDLIDFRTDDSAGRTVFVGLPEDMSDELLTKLYARAQNGATAVFLCPEALAGEGNKMIRLPFENNGECTYYRNWLYHVDHAHKRHPAFDRLHDEGICDMDFFASAYPKNMLRLLPKPDKAISACVGIGYGLTTEDGSLAGLSLGEYNLGKGKIVLNTFQLTDGVGGNPVADQMLLNLADFY